MNNLHNLQEIYFDLVDLIENNPNLLKIKIDGLEEFSNLGEFLFEQKTKLEIIESSNPELFTEPTTEEDKFNALMQDQKFKKAWEKIQA
jgi:hypothetical protein